MRRAYLFAGWGIIILGAAHMFATTRLFSEVTPRAVWFFGAGIAMALTGSLNLLNAAYGLVAPGVRRVCFASNVAMTLFAIVAGRVTGASVPEQLIIVGLTGAATAFSLRAVAIRDRSTHAEA